MRPAPRVCPNVWLGVERLSGERSKREAVLSEVLTSRTPGIVFTATSRHSEEIAAALAQRKVKAGAYHSELRKESRSALRVAFSRSELEVIVATGEAGSELDALDVHFVFHYDLSQSLSAYYDEITRAGRTEAARAVLFYSPEDVGLRRFLAESGRLDREDIERVAQTISEADEPLRLRELRDYTGLSQAKLLRALARLEEVGLVETLPRGEIAGTDSTPNLSDAVEVAARAHERRRQADQIRVEPMRTYAELSSCRRAYLLKHLGQDYEPPCNNCDVCQETAAGDGPRSARRVRPSFSDKPDPFPIGSEVVHKSWGPGTVTSYEGDARGTVVVCFAVGERRLSLEVVKRAGLLQAGG